jgi:phosphonate transport system substrate-binding protein
MGWGICLSVACHGAEGPLNFGVINQRSVSLTAQTWNPILDYVGRHAGVSLQLKIGRTAPETTAMTVRGEHAFAYTNHMFTPERDQVGYRVILRMAGAPIQGVIVVREESPVRSVADLAGKAVAFPSKEAFVGYWLPMDHLKKQRIDVQEVLAGNQEAAMSQLQFGQVGAAAVNSKILAKYAQREGFRYRIVWTSESYLDIPVMAHPSLPPELVKRVRQAFLDMGQHPEGQKALRASADALGSSQPWSFLAAEDREYDNYRQFYRHTVLRGD